MNGCLSWTWESELIGTYSTVYTNRNSTLVYSRGLENRGFKKMESFLSARNLTSCRLLTDYQHTKWHRQEHTERKREGGNCALWMLRPLYLFMVNFRRQSRYSTLVTFLRKKFSQAVSSTKCKSGTILQT